MVYDKPWFNAYENRWYGDYRKVDFPDNPPCPRCGGHTIITRHRIRDAEMNWKFAQFMCGHCGFIFEEKILPGYEYLLIENMNDQA